MNATTPIIRVLGAMPSDPQYFQQGYAVYFQQGYAVGHGDVTRIERREEVLGDYGIVWFDAFIGDHLVASMNACFVSEVEYAKAAAEHIPLNGR